MDLRKPINHLEVAGDLNLIFELFKPFQEGLKQIKFISCLINMLRFKGFCCRATYKAKDFLVLKFRLLH